MKTQNSSNILGSLKSNKCELNVEGMHCASCEITIEKALSKHKNIKNVNAKLDKNKVIFELIEMENNGNEDIDLEQLTSELNELLSHTDYKLQTKDIEKKEINFVQLINAFFIASTLILAFLIIQKLGISNILNAEEITYPFIFLIGIVASLSTCMAVVGGLVLSISSSYTKYQHKNKLTPILHFHLARIIGFFILGGIIGYLGSMFTLSIIATLLLNVVLFLVMFILGLDLLGIFNFTKAIQLRMPKLIAKKVLVNENTNYITPIILGVITFLLPCGFTQSMQFYTLTTGSFISGALTMFVYALGTLPVLALLSFASIKFSKGLQSGLFFKVSGFIVLFLAIFNVIAALVAAGIIEPVFNI